MFCKVLSQLQSFCFPGTKTCEVTFVTCLQCNISSFNEFPLDSEAYVSFYLFFIKIIKSLTSDTGVDSRPYTTEICKENNEGDGDWVVRSDNMTVVAGKNVVVGEYECDGTCVVSIHFHSRPRIIRTKIRQNLMRIKQNVQIIHTSKSM